MKKRMLIFSGLVATVSIGCYLSFLYSRSTHRLVPDADTYTYIILFKSAVLVLPMAAFCSIFLRALIHGASKEPIYENGKFLRHNSCVFFAHWTHAISVIILLISGIALGPLSLSRWVHTPETTGIAFNLHFMGAALFVFGLFFSVSGVMIKGSLKNLLPDTKDISMAISYYRTRLQKRDPPRQGKYLSSERLAFPVWVVLMAGILLSGAIKVCAHWWVMPATFMEKVTFAHDAFALGVLVMLAVHVILGSVVPWSWPLFRSMVTGYISEEYVQKHHLGWYETLKEEIKHGR